jgi:hypothetical protein
VVGDAYNNSYQYFRKADSPQQAIDSRQQTADSRQQTADSRQQAAVTGSRQYHYPAVDPL